MQNIIKIYASGIYFCSPRRVVGSRNGSNMAEIKILGNQFYEKKKRKLLDKLYRATFDQNHVFIFLRSICLA